MQVAGESAFARGFWNGVCSPFLLFSSDSRDPLPVPRRDVSLVKLPDTLPSLPPLRTLEEVERSVPGGADRVLRMIEEAHRAAFRESTHGHWMGFALVILAIAAGVATALMGCAWQVSVALVGLPLVGVVRAFLPQRKNTG